MKFSYETQGAITYLVCELDAAEQLDTLTLGMLTNNHIAGLAPVLYTEMNGQRFLKYNISAKVTAAQFFGGTMPRQRALNAISNILAAICSADDYMIEPNCFMVAPGYLFLNVSSCEVAMLCIPVVTEKNIHEEVGAFLRQLLCTTQFDPAEDVGYVTQMITYINSGPSFTIYGMRDLVARLQAEPVLPAKPPVAPAAPAQPQVKAAPENAADVMFGATIAIDDMPAMMARRQQAQAAAAAAAKAPEAPVTPAAPMPQTPVAPAVQPPVAPQPKAPEVKPQVQAAPQPPVAPAPQPPVAPAPQPPVAPRPQAPVNPNGNIPAAPVKPAQQPPVRPQAAPPAQAQTYAPAQPWPQQPQNVPPRQAPAQNGHGFAIPGQNMNGTMPPQPPRPQQPAPQQPQQAAAGEKKMSFFGLLSHYSKENAELYKKQKEEAKSRKASAKAAPQPVAPPAVSAPGPMPTQGNVPPMQQQYAQPQFQPPVRPVPVQNSFNETTVLSPGMMGGETTVLNAGMMKPDPALIRVKTGEKISINKPVFRIGKEKSYVDYFVGDNTAISRSHANIHTDNGEYFIEDTNSTNHTYLNGKLINSNEKIKLTSGDKVKLANEEFIFSI